MGDENLATGIDNGLILGRGLAAFWHRLYFGATEDSPSRGEVFAA
jgi:hypothetical protein